MLDREACHGDSIPIITLDTISRLLDSWFLAISATDDTPSRSNMIGDNYPVPLVTGMSINKKEFTTMRTIKFFTMLVTLVILFNSSNSSAEEDQTTTISRWNQDLDFIYQRLLSTHPDPFTSIPKDTFDLTVKTLRENLSQLTEDEIKTEIIRLVGMIADGHTRLHGKQLSDLWFPIRVVKFEDGHFVTAASPDYQNLIGAKVVKIGRFEAIEAFKMIGSVLSSDNQYSGDYYAPAALTMASIMGGLNITRCRDTIDLTIQFKGAEIQDVHVAANEYESDQ